MLYSYLQIQPAHQILVHVFLFLYIDLKSACTLIHLWLIWHRRNLFWLNVRYNFAIHSRLIYYFSHPYLRPLHPNWMCAKSDSISFGGFTLAQMINGNISKCNLAPSIWNLGSSNANSSFTFEIWSWVFRNQVSETWRETRYTF